MATKKAVKAATQPAAPAKVQTPPKDIDNIAAVHGRSLVAEASDDVLAVRLASTEHKYAAAVSEVGRLGDELRVLRAELAASRS